MKKIAFQSTLTLALLLARIGAQAENQWQFVSIPGLPANSSLGSVWARGTLEVYVWAGRITPETTDVPECFLYRWDGQTWTQVLNLPGHYAAGVFGTGPSDVFAVANACEDGYGAGCGPSGRGRIYHSVDSGASWNLEALPAIADSNPLGGISGTSSNVHVIVISGYEGHIIRFDGATWSDIFTSDYDDPPYALTMLSATEGYFIGCWGWGRWDGATWQWQGRQFDFCDISACWAIRDPINQLDLFAVGNHNFADGDYIWKFDEASQSFVGKYDTVFGEGAGYHLGYATGIWGSAPDDIYVTGHLSSTQDGPSAGRLYHYDGTTWSRVTSFGEIASAATVWGTSSNDVWVALSDGQLLHSTSATPASLDLKMYAGLSISGAVGAKYRVEFSPTPGFPNTWTTLTNLTLPASPYLLFDLNSPVSPHRFYRVVSVE